MVEKSKSREPADLTSPARAGEKGETEGRWVHMSWKANKTEVWGMKRGCVIRNGIRIDGAMEQKRLDISSRCVSCSGKVTHEVAAVVRIYQ